MARAKSKEPENEKEIAFDITAEVNRFFDESSLSEDGQPQIVIVCGPTGTGKTRYRRKKYAHGYAVVDAADIFISLSRGKYIDFPSFLEEPMDLIGAMVANRAIKERRNIVTEIIGHVFEPFQGLIEAMRAIDYKVDLDAVVKDPVEAWEWNLKRSDDNISAFYTEQYHRKWLISAASEIISSAE